MKKSLWVLLLALPNWNVTPALEPPTREHSLRVFLPQWEEAQRRFINGDPSLWKEHCSHQDDATLLGAFGGFGEKGWTALSARNDWASSQYKPSEAKLKVEYLSVVVQGDLGYTVAIERQENVRLGEGQTVPRRALRATQIFRKEGGWKLIHRHADPLIEKQGAATAVPGNLSQRESQPLMAAFNDLKWVALPQRKGMQYAVLSGNPTTGAYSQIRKVPAGMDNGLHTHSSELKNVIISGVWYTGPDMASAKNYGPGSVVIMPAHWPHVSGTRPDSDCVFYQEG